MSELQLALLIVAALLLLALYVSGKWQERRLLRRLRERLHGGVGDALLRAGDSPLRGREEGRATPPRPPAPAGATLPASVQERIEPRIPDSRPTGEDLRGPGAVATPPGACQPETGLEIGAAAASAGRESHSGGVGNDDDGPGVTSERLVTPVALLQPDWAEDPLLDCSLEMRFARAVDGVSVIDAVAVLAHTHWDLAVHFVVWDGRHQQWVLPDRFGYYTDALVSIQLADRRSRLDEDTIDRFVQLVRQVATALDADVDAPDAQRLLLQAQELDRLCARFDVKIGLTVESTGGAWTGPQVRSAAQHAHFAAVGAMHAQRWVRADSQGEPLYTMQAETAAMNRLTLELDIALAPVAARAFRAMVDSATELAAALDGRVVDDNGEPIDARSMDAVDAQLARMYEEMRAAGIEPGSPRARRLYV